MTDDARVLELRKLFVVHDDWTYLLNGSIHPCAAPVREAMARFLDQWSRGGEAAFFPAYDAFNKLREKFAALIHTDARHIVVTESTTAAINLAAHIVRPPGRPRDARQNVVVTDLEFMSNTYPWLVSQAPLEVRFAESVGGAVTPESIAAKVDANTVAVHTCAVTVGSGYRFDLAELHAAIAKKKPGTPLIVDAAQALGVVGVNARQPELDFLACTASKWLMGPAGVGFLYVHEKYFDAQPPAAGWLSAANVGDWDIRRCELYPDARRFQGGIPNLVGVVGALAGLELLEQVGREFIERRVHALTTYLIDSLVEIGVEIWTPRPAHQRAGIVFFRTPEHHKLHAKLKEKRFYVGNFLGGIRVDPTFYNTVEELDRLLHIVKEHVAQHAK